MAVVIASDLHKDIAGEPLLRGISFKLERRDRMTLSGRNGAGKTTLLRMLAGEASIDGGELVLAKGAKVALHDQRPPRERDLSLRDYVLAGAPEMVAIEAELAELEAAMAAGAHDDATLTRYADAQARLEHGGGYGWRERALQTLHRLGFSDDAHLDRRLATFSGGELTRASLARALAGDPDLLLLDEPTQPPRHRVAGVARGPPHLARRGDRARRPRSVVPGGCRHLGAGARGRGAGSSSPGPGTPGGGRRRPVTSPSAGRSSVRRPRSSGSSGSSPGSGPAPGPDRPSRGPSSCRRSSG